MNNNFSNLNSGFGTGKFQDQYVNGLSLYPYVVYPQSTEDSTNIVGDSFITQSVQPTWIVDSSTLTGYSLVNQLQWCITFQGSDMYYQGYPVCIFDCPRTTLFTFNAQVINSPTVTINGWDNKLRECVEQGTLEQNVDTQSFFKSFKMIRSIYFSAYPFASQSNVDTITVSGSNTLGLPYFINKTNSISSISWNGAPVAINATYNSSPIITPGFVWRQNSPSYTTGDAFGTINLQGQSPLPNGTIPLNLNYYVYGNDLNLDSQLSSYVKYQASQISNSATTYQYTNNFNYGSAAQIIDVKNNINGIATMPTLQTQDLFGSQFPSDLDFTVFYNNQYNAKG